MLKVATSPPCTSGPQTRGNSCGLVVTAVGDNYLFSALGGAGRRLSASCLTIYVWIGSASAVRVDQPRARTSNRYFIYQCNDYDASLDLDAGEMYCAVKRLTNTLVAYPFRRVLWRWLARQKLFPIQGAVLARGQSAVLLCGERGSGRSTAALECIEAGWDLVADTQRGVGRLGTHSLFTACSAASSSIPSTPKISQTGANIVDPATDPAWRAAR